MHCVCNHREQMKVQKSLKFTSRMKLVQLQFLKLPKQHYNVNNVLKAYDNAPQHQKVLKRLPKAKTALKVNEILPL